MKLPETKKVVEWSKMSEFEVDDFISVRQVE